LIVKDTNDNITFTIMIKYKWSITHSIDMYVFDHDEINFATFEIRGRLDNRTDIRALVLGKPNTLLRIDEEYAQKLTSKGVALDLHLEDKMRKWVDEDRLDRRTNWMSSFFRLFNIDFLAHPKGEFFSRKPTTDLPRLLKDELLPSDMSDNRKLSILITVLFTKLFVNR